MKQKNKQAKYRCCGCYYVFSQPPGPNSPHWSKKKIYDKFCPMCGGLYVEWLDYVDK